MKATAASRWVCGIALGAAAVCRAQQPGTASGPAAGAVSTPLAPAAPADRLILSGDGATLTGTDGGGGGSAGYLHAFSADALVGVGVEYQRLYTADWAFGSLNAAYSHALTATTRWSVHGEVHEGEGHTAGSFFRYGIEAVGAGSSLPGGLALDLEERQIDVAGNYGSLPKATLSKVWGTRWLTTLSYAHSVGGNLDTSYTLARVDYTGTHFNVLAGGSLGRVNPVVLNINGVLEGQTRHLNEFFFGLTKPFGRFDLSLLADEIDLEGIRHFTGTLTGTWYLR